MTSFGILLRCLAIVAILLTATWLSSILREHLGVLMVPADQIYRNWMIWAVIFLFVALLALPFVPGAEIGMTMLTMFGAPIAPLIYAATIVALMLSYTVGRFVPTQTVVEGLRMVGLTRAAAGVEGIAALPPKERLDRLMQGQSPRMIRLAARFRFLAILLAINIPGNFLIGGGGGIAMVAGMSGLFAPLPFLVTVAVAVAPLPLMVFLMLA